MKRNLCKAASLLLVALFLLVAVGCSDDTGSSGEKVKITVEFDDSTSIFNYMVELREIFPEYEFELKSMV